MGSAWGLVLMWWVDARGQTEGFRGRIREGFCPGVPVAEGSGRAGLLLCPWTLDQSLPLLGLVSSPVGWRAGEVLGWKNLRVHFPAGASSPGPRL